MTDLLVSLSTKLALRVFKKRPQGPASGEGEKLCLKQNLKEGAYLRVLRKRLGGGGLRCPRGSKGLPGALPGASRSRSDVGRFRDLWNPENQGFP